MKIHNKKNKIVQATKSSEATKKHEEVTSMMTYNSHEWAENIMLIVELRKKLLAFRDIIDLPPCDDSGAIEEVIILSAERKFNVQDLIFNLAHVCFFWQLMVVTVEDLHNLYPNVVPHILNKETSMDQVH